MKKLILFSLVFATSISAAAWADLAGEPGTSASASVSADTTTPTPMEASASGDATVTAPTPTPTKEDASVATPVADTSYQTVSSTPYVDEAAGSGRHWYNPFSWFRSNSTATESASVNRV